MSKSAEKSSFRTLRATGPAALPEKVEQALAIRWDFSDKTLAAIDAVETAIRSSDRRVKNFVLR